MATKRMIGHQDSEASKKLKMSSLPIPLVIRKVTRNIIFQVMAIEQPLDALRKLLEHKLQCSLKEHKFFLQNQIELDSSKNLIDHGIKGEGLVQFNVQIFSQPAGSSPKINIIDVLKPETEMKKDTRKMSSVTVTPEVVTRVATIPTESTKPFTRWVVDKGFQRQQERIGMPKNLRLWTREHVHTWLEWALGVFPVRGIDVSRFDMTGEQLADLKHFEFSRLVPNDPDDLLWTHVELLRKCHFAAIVQRTVTSGGSAEGRSFSRVTTGGELVTSSMGSISSSPSSSSKQQQAATSSVQIQLWQFLLELLTDKDCKQYIQWMGDEGEFRLNNPEMVAKLWGKRKGKENMNYEKLSRALRYYYDGDMIAKVYGKRFVYKFVCDLEALLGYSAAELNSLVQRASSKTSW